VRQQRVSKTLKVSENKAKTADWNPQYPKETAACSSKLEAGCLLTIKYNNSPSRRVRSNNKNAHLSVFNQEMGQREVVKNRTQDLPWSANGFPFRGNVRRTKGWGYSAFANNNKTKHAYET
jgi:hypothetical protein